MEKRDFYKLNHEQAFSVLKMTKYVLKILHLSTLVKFDFSYF